MNFNGKKVTVMGIGFHEGGSGVAQYLAENGAIVTATDLNPAEKLPEAIEQLKNLPIRWVLGGHDVKDFINADLIIRNPAVPANSKYLAIAREHGIPVEMESSLFFKLTPSRNIVAVTGTKGKSTTSHLAAHVLKTAGEKVHLMGNLAKNMLLEIPSIESDAWVVLELSSYQCEGFEPHVDDFRKNSFGPAFGILTNLYPDHLNRYGTMEPYARAKKQLFNTQNNTQHTLLNAESEWKTFFAEGLESTITYYDSHSLPDSWKLTLPGLHNRLNAGAVYLMGKKLGLDENILEKAMLSFRGVEHRLEFVRNFNGVAFYNDSTATNPSAALAGIRTIGETGKKLVLIAGGNDKDMFYEDLIGEINSKKVPTVVLAGTADKHFKKIESDLQLGFFTDFREAIKTAYKAASDDGIVLLSPGATSFNIFRDEFDRGRQFKETVNSL